ncbi:MAG: hypothetical protein HQL52_05440 [Magnetococcales bacterium]|nr:hypothetical protein [Magnetococcales bacterium]
MDKIFRYLGQGLTYTIFCALIYYLSTSPAYTYLAEGQAELKVAFNHAGQRVEECRKRTPEELRKLPPNMRKPMDCSRERSPLIVEIRIDGKPLARDIYNPPGIHSDGAAFVYGKYAIPAGEHELEVELWDSTLKPEFSFHAKKRVSLAPGQGFVVGFDEDNARFLFY